MWQDFLQQRPAGDNLALLSVAVDAQPERVRPFTQGLPFPTVVDTTGVLGRTFDFDVVPNGVLMDETGVIRLLHIGGFDIRREDVRANLTALLAANLATDAPPPPPSESLEIEMLRVELADQPDSAALACALADALLRDGRPGEAADAFRRAAALDPADWSPAFGLGTILWGEGRTDEALSWWQKALALDPSNFTVRKQIWCAEYPERFYPEIDVAWQAEQLEREGYRR